MAEGTERGGNLAPDPQLRLSRSGARPAKHDGDVSLRRLFPIISTFRSCSSIPRSSGARRLSNPIINSKSRAVARLLDDGRPCSRETAPPTRVPLRPQFVDQLAAGWCRVLKCTPRSARRAVIASLCGKLSHPISMFSRAPGRPCSTAGTWRLASSALRFDIRRTIRAPLASDRKIINRTDSTSRTRPAHRLRVHPQARDAAGISFRIRTRGQFGVCFESPRLFSGCRRHTKARASASTWQYRLARQIGYAAEAAIFYQQVRSAASEKEASLCWRKAQQPRPNHPRCPLI